MPGNSIAVAWSGTRGDGSVLYVDGFRDLAIGSGGWVFRTQPSGTVGGGALTPTLNLVGMTPSGFELGVSLGTNLNYADRNPLLDNYNASLSGTKIWGLGSSPFGMGLSGSLGLERVPVEVDTQSRYVGEIFGDDVGVGGAENRPLEEDRDWQIGSTLGAMAMLEVDFSRWLNGLKLEIQGGWGGAPAAQAGLRIEF